MSCTTPYQIGKFFKGIGKMQFQTLLVEDNWQSYFILFYLFIGVYLLYNVVLVSAVLQSESALCIHISLLFWISFSFKSPQSIKQSSLCYTAGSHQLSILYILVYICQSQAPNSSRSPFPPLVYICLFSMSVSLFLADSFQKGDVTVL